MNIKKKLLRKNTKKAFTLVELVIVISILAILAAIAIPVITTTINSSKLSVMESDSATVEMMLKEALTAYKSDIENVEYNGNSPDTATVEDVLIENNIDLNIMSMRKIGGVDYAIYWNNAIEGTVLISGSGITEFDLTTQISDLGTL